MMVAWYIPYKLVEGSSVQDFLLAQEKCSTEVLSKKKGFVSWQVLSDGDTWIDFVTWETEEDAIHAEQENGDIHPAAQAFYGFIDPSTLQHQMLSIEKTYK
ncbi:MAG: hypothetical protein FWE05_09395 [Defluviitaleaceae bacterium]|nr:hypothetical protein [Defluviitaleaceae bacterium]